MPLFTYRVVAQSSTDVTVHADCEENAYDAVLDRIATLDSEDFSISEVDLRNHRFDVELIDEE